MIGAMVLSPLSGFVVGVTADRRWQEQAELLMRRGASVLHGPTMTTLYLASDDDLRRATESVLAQPPHYVVATTGIGMRAWMEAAAAWGMGDDLSAALAGARIVARGPKAASAVSAGGLECWARSPNEQLGPVVEMLLAEDLAGMRVAIQEYGVPNPEMTAALAAAGAEVVEVPVYRWRLPADRSGALRLVEAVCTEEVDAVTFTSAPAVANLVTIAHEAGRDRELLAAFNRERGHHGVVAACVGPVCAEGAVAVGIDNPLVPDVGRLGLMVRTLSNHFESHRRRYVCQGHELVVQGSAVSVDGELAEFSTRERALFEALARPPGAVVFRTALLDRVWGPGSDPHVLDVTVARLRRRLGPCGVSIQTSPGRGYRLAADPA